jgi:hypothetical protein
MRPLTDMVRGAGGPETVAGKQAAMPRQAARRPRRGRVRSARKAEP